MAEYVETIDVPIQEIVDWPGNPKEHAEEEIDASVQRYGQYKAVLGRRLDDGAVQLLAGHGTRDGFARAGYETLRVEVIQVKDDAEARGIVLTDNRLPSLAGYNERLLLEQLEAARAEHGLEGTGWDDEQTRALADKLNEPTGPGEFPEVDPDTIETQHECPQCGYRWSGKSAAAAEGE